MIVRADRNAITVNVRDQMSFFDGDSPEDIIAREKAKVMEAADQGCNCPVCGKWVKKYRRTITAAVAFTLIRLYHLNKIREWVHTRDLVVPGQQSSVGDFTKSVVWGLIEPKQHKTGDEGKKTSGYWRITELGRMFVQRKISVRRYVILYNDAVEGWEGNDVLITDCLKEKFDYNELMKGLRHG